MMAGAAGDDERREARSEAATIFSLQPHVRMAQMQTAEPLVLAALEVLTADRLVGTIQPQDDDGERPVIEAPAIEALRVAALAATQDLSFPSQEELRKLLRTVTGDGGVPVPGGLLSEAFAFHAGDKMAQTITSKFADFAGKEPMMFNAVDHPTLSQMNRGEWISADEERYDKDYDDFGFFWEHTSKPRKPCVCSTPALPH
jgi:hypothetical protein